MSASTAHAFSAHASVAEGFPASSHDHAAAAEGIGDFLIAAISIIIVVAAFLLCIKYLLFPKEKEDTHIKKRILDDEVRDDRGLRHER